jgi:acyl-coenzyme A thioesterase PaaI-like protein
MTYLRPVPNGAKTTIESEVVAAGRNTANLVGRILVNGKVCVTCVHDKAVFSRKPMSKL